ncbi:MAG: DUF3604 domain-containing protein [Proteobacteria bacterium]|nr:DUF3604 domain-containing protein [Pseudomonadota bacterium]
MAARIEDLGRWAALAASFSASLAVAGCSAQAQTTAKPHAPRHATAPAADKTGGDRSVYFGELHLHTAYSFDAWSLMGTKTTPEQAYDFMQGKPVKVNGVWQKRAWPLDFAAVTDHSENMGVMNQLDDPDNAFAKTEIGQRIVKDTAQAFYILKNAVDHHTPVPGLNPKPAMRSAWDREIAAANGAYKPGRFTSFIGYEWSSMDKGRYNLHRNVIFKGDTAPMPFTSGDSPRPEDLWTYLEKNRAAGVEAIAIPHNGNVSGGLMYDWNDSDGRPISEAYAQHRALNEPLTEIVQNKGQSDTLPELSSSDEFAEFEIFDRLLTHPEEKSKPHGSYIREAFGRGLVIQQKVGANPFKYGVVGGADLHNGLETSDENAMAGGPFGIDPKTALPSREEAKHRLNLVPTPALIDEEAEEQGKPHRNEDNTIFSSAGLTGVWAEKNDRDSIFAALKRKETFATSGPRIRVRAFGGWAFGADALGKPGWTAKAYATGVPMGGDLPQRPAGAGAPSFILQAMKAPESGNLDRIQVIKVWLDGQGYKEKVFDVALSGGRKVDPKTGKAPAVGNTVDLKTGAYKNTIGAPALQTVWRDPQFDPAKPAVYYVRVLEIPTPRWTTLLAIKRHLPFPANRPTTIQERAWGSPIWYTPASPQQAQAPVRAHAG